LRVRKRVPWRRACALRLRASALPARGAGQRARVAAAARRRAAAAQAAAFCLRRGGTCAVSTNGFLTRAPPLAAAAQVACLLFFTAIWALWAYAEVLHSRKRKSAHRRARARGRAAQSTARTLLPSLSRARSRCIARARREADEKPKQDRAHHDVESSSAAAAAAASGGLASPTKAPAGAGGALAEIAEAAPPAEVPPALSTHNATWRCAPRTHGAAPRWAGLRARVRVCARAGA
jgi:hypothetical protein